MKINVYWYQKVAENKKLPPILVKVADVDVPLVKVVTDGWHLDRMDELYERNAMSLTLNINDESPDYDFVVAYVPEGYTRKKIWVWSKQQMKIAVDIYDVRY